MFTVELLFQKENKIMPVGLKEKKKKVIYKWLIEQHLASGRAKILGLAKMEMKRCVLLLLNFFFFFNWFIYLAVLGLGRGLKLWCTGFDGM